MNEMIIEINQNKKKNMKFYFIGISFILLSILLYFSIKKEPNITVCCLVEESGGILTKDDEIIKSQNGVITYITSTFIVTSEENDIIEGIKEMYFEEEHAYDYAAYYDYEGINYSIKELENGVEVVAELTVSKASINELVEAGLIYSSTVEGEKIKLHLMIELFEDYGFICE